MSFSGVLFVGPSALCRVPIRQSVLLSRLDDYDIVGSYDGGAKNAGVEISGVGLNEIALSDYSVKYNQYTHGQSSELQTDIYSYSAYIRNGAHRT